MAEGLVKPSAAIVPMRAINGAGTCGMERPLKVAALNQGTVEVAPKATLACPVTASVDRWVAEDIQPAAYAWFGQPVVKIKQMSSYSCRNMNGGPAGKISEHAFGNAFDVGGFVLADGREVLVKTGWKGQADERGFLRTVQYTACQRFTTVLAPGSNVYHYDHIHVDLMRRTSGRMACNPAPVLPQPPMNRPIYKAPPMAGMPAPTPAYYPPVKAPPMTASPMTAAPRPAPAYAPAAAPVPLGTPEPAEEMEGAVGEPMVLGPQAVPAQAAAPEAPAQAAYPPAASPPPTYAQPSYGQPAYPAPAQPAYAAPQPAYAPPPSTARPSGVPLPPAGIPMVMRWLGLDPKPTASVDGSTAGTTAQAYAPERRLATPIPPPPAPEAGSD